MTDIVERFRQFAAVIQGRDPRDYAVPVPAVAIIEAADEIERLRAALDEAAEALHEEGLHATAKVARTALGEEKR